MAKKIIFLLVMMLVLLLASVTAFAVDTETSTLKKDLTEDKANLVDKPMLGINDLHAKYGDIFFDEKSSSDKNIIAIKYEREYSVVNALRHTFTGSVVDDSTTSANPVIMLMYIKVNGKYIPLNDIDTGSNLAEGPWITYSKVDLEYLGSDKVNEVRIIAFRKNDATELALNRNLQILDLQITVRYWKLAEKLRITYNDFKNNLTPSTP